METLILNCLQAQLIVSRINSYTLPKQTRNDLIWEVKQISPKECRIDIKSE